jgi:hypothetical protein
MRPWLTIIFAALAAWAIGFFLVNPSQAPGVKDVFSTILPAYLQGFATLAAAIFAFQAFESWNKQELAKRRSGAAEEILLLAHRATAALRSARRAAFIDNLEIYADQPLHLAIEDAATLFTPDMEKLFAELEMKYKLGSWLGLGQHVSVREILLLRRQIYGAMITLESLLAASLEQRVEVQDDWLRMVHKELVVLGWNPNAPKNYLGRLTNETDSKLQLSLDRLTEHLGAHVRYQTT